MCIMAYIKAGVALPSKDTLQSCWNRNRDWGGFMFATDDKLMIEKYKDFDSFYSALQQMHSQYGSTSDFIFHMRLATNGAISFENTHPFRVNTNWAFAHNGIITQFSQDKSVSDSLLFGREVLRPLLFNKWVMNERVKQLIQKFIGGYNKVLLMNNKGEVVIFNEDSGEWDSDIWWSNSGYKTYGKDITDTTVKRIPYYKYESNCSCCNAKIYVRNNLMFHYSSSDVLVIMKDVCYACRKNAYTLHGGEYKYTVSCTKCNSNLAHQHTVCHVFDADTLKECTYCNNCFMEFLIDKTQETFNCNSFAEFIEVNDFVDQYGRAMVGLSECDESRVADYRKGVN